MPGTDVRAVDAARQAAPDHHHEHGLARVFVSSSANFGDHAQARAANFSRQWHCSQVSPRGTSRFGLDGEGIGRG